MVELLIVGLIVVWSSIVVFKKVLPKTSMRVFMSLSQRCEQQGWQSLAKWLKPAAATGCGGSCSCENDPAEPAAKKVEIQAVKWK